jgi:hypothetical protein
MTVSTEKVIQVSEEDISMLFAIGLVQGVLLGKDKIEAEFHSVVSFCFNEAVTKGILSKELTVDKTNP